MHAFRLARNCWGGYIFLLMLFWLFFMLTGIAMDFPGIFTVIMSLAYFCGAYSLGWRAGKKDFKIHNFSIKSALLGGVLGIILSFVSLIFIIIGKIFGQDTGIFSLAADIYTFLHCHFIYFITSYRDNILTYAVPVILVLILYPLGYFIGSKGFSIIDKYFPILLYRKKGR